MAQVKRTKAKHNSTVPQFISKNHDWLDNQALIFFPEKADWRKRLNYSMMKWAEDDNALEIGQFCMDYKVSKHTLREWVLKYPDVAEAYKQMKYMIATRRKVGCIKKQYDPASCFKDMHTLDEDWIAVDQYHNNLKKDIQNDNTTKVIVLSQLETGELVPISGKKDEDVHQAPLLPSE